MDKLSILSSLSSHLENSVFHAIEKNRSLASLVEYVLFSNDSSVFLPLSIENRKIFTECYISNIELFESLNLCLKAIKEVVLQVSDVYCELSNSQKWIDDAIFRENEIYDVNISKSIDLKNEDDELSEYFSGSKCKLFEVNLVSLCDNSLSNYSINSPNLSDLSETLHLQVSYNSLISLIGESGIDPSGYPALSHLQRPKSTPCRKSSGPGVFVPVGPFPTPMINDRFSDFPH